MKIVSSLRVRLRVVTANSHFFRVGAWFTYGWQALIENSIVLSLFLSFGAQIEVIVRSLLRMLSGVGESLLLALFLIDSRHLVVSRASIISISSLRLPSNGSFGHIWYAVCLAPSEINRLEASQSLMSYDQIEGTVAWWPISTFLMVMLMGYAP